MSAETKTITNSVGAGTESVVFMTDTRFPNRLVIRQGEDTIELAISKIEDFIAQMQVHLTKFERVKELGV